MNLSDDDLLIKNAGDPQNVSEIAAAYTGQITAVAMVAEEEVNLVKPNFAYVVSNYMYFIIIIIIFFFFFFFFYYLVIFFVFWKLYD